MHEDYVYIIEGINNNNKTKYYIGYTNNPYNRIRQHNRLIKGGAKATANYTWKYVGLIFNIEDNIEGLQIEWRLKHATKKYNIIDRINAFLEYLENNNKVSSNSEILNHQLFFSVHPKLYNKLNKKIWSNIIIEDIIIENSDILLLKNNI